MRSLRAAHFDVQRASHEGYPGFHLIPDKSSVNRKLCGCSSHNHLHTESRRLSL
jgi:hypothetical protein